MSVDPSYDFSAPVSAPLTYPKEAGDLKKGDHVLISGRACRVTETTVHKGGKHGHTKTLVYATDIFSGKKLEDWFPSDQSVDCPVVKREDAEVVLAEKASGFCTLKMEEGFREDLKLPKEGEWLEAFWLEYGKKKRLVVSVLSTMGEERLIGFREDKEK